MRRNKSSARKHREQIFWIVVEKGRPLRFSSVVNIFIVTMEITKQAGLGFSGILC